MKPNVCELINNNNFFMLYKSVLNWEIDCFSLTSKRIIYYNYFEWPTHNKT